MDTTVDFRRKLLRFVRPHYHDYARHDIPRYYSNFGPRTRTSFPYWDCPDKGPSVYPISFSIDKVWEPDCPCDVHGWENITGGSHTNTFVWMLVVIIIVVTLMLKR
jgi:hypothetical protein